MEQNRELYLVAYRKDIEDLNSFEPDDDKCTLRNIQHEMYIRLYNNIQSAIDSEVELMSFRYKVVGLADKSINGFDGDVSIREIVNAGKKCFDELLVFKVMLKEYTKFIEYGEHKKTFTPLKRKSPVNIEFIDTVGNKIGLTSKTEANISDCLCTYGSNVSSAELVAESDSNLDEELGSLLDLYKEALDNAILNELM